MTSASRRGCRVSQEVLSATDHQAECLFAMAEARGIVSSPDDALDAADEAMDLYLELRETWSQEKASSRL